MPCINILNRDELKEAILLLLSSDEHKGEITLSFERMYGKCGERLDEDTWLSWFGVWVSAWQEAIKYYRISKFLKGK